ncbi:endonuclease [Halobacillus salinarum]|uniref:Endonuclease n=1 Tax=Halobacillus salinarum TaxID=2932257 RepID=A0ABY4EJA6_9BACI|nr:endonuclease [Halobacillus salinarum]UOQ43938.1 endonuclease [Halobacillus salinarum]
MPITPQQKEKYVPSSTDHEHVKANLQRLKENKEKIQQDQKSYYDDEQDDRDKKNYYKEIDFSSSKSDELRESLSQLLRDTHKKKLSYDPSEHLYPWVDLRPDGELMSIYSGQNRKPEDVIQEDFEASLQREEQLIKTAEYPDQLNIQMLEAVAKLKYNCEHSVPQSWFDEHEPMRGDLHHLFTCEPLCNSIRSNYPYHDFSDYKPGSVNAERIEDSCGKAENELFEPEHGKGTVARGVLYFLLRYPNEIETKHLQGLDLELLMKWHKKFPPALYEKHRNQAIYEEQGNRNPYIDHPEKMGELK